MKRLIRHGLMFGNLIEVSSPVMVARYNRALKHLTGRETTLTEFYIDMTGYSPEIGDEFGDDQYLNQNGCNRQFILLTADQKTAPVLNAKFSTTQRILRRFMEANSAQIFALTAQDAVGGELLNSVYDLPDAAALFDIRNITVEADTTQSHVANAEELAEMITEFKTSKDGWWDDVLIAKMIGLAKKTGDVTRHPVRLKSRRYVQENMWTSHFGGLFVFQNLDHPAIIAVGEKPTGRLPIKHVFDLNDRNSIAKFLQLNDLVEPIVKVRGIDATGIIQQKMDFIVIDHATRNGDDLRGATRRDIRALARRHARDLPKEFDGLSAMLRWAEGGGKWPRITSDHPAYFYTVRAKNHENRDLVNMLLAELTRMDILQLFICHKERFYEEYATWSDAKKDFVVDFLVSEYQADKAGARDALFGEQNAPERHERVSERKIARVGPWGRIGDR